MTPAAVVITGVGTISALGIDHELFGGLPFSRAHQLVENPHALVIPLFGARKSSYVDERIVEV